MAVDQVELPRESRIRKWLKRGDTGAIVPELDENASQYGNYADNTAHSTDATPVSDANIPASKKFLMKQINITNDEVYNVLVSVYDGPSATGTLIDRFYVGATSTLGVTEMSGYEFTTSVVFITVGAASEAWAASTSVRVGGILLDT